MSRLSALVCVALALALAAPSSTGCASAPEKKKEKRARKYDGPIIDLHAHYDANNTDAWDKNLAHPRVFKIAALVTATAGNMTETRAQNDRVIALAAQNPKVYPVASVHPADGKAALDELDRLYQANVRAVLLNTTAMGIAIEDARTNDVVAKTAALGMLVMIETMNASDPGVVGKVLALAVRNPTARIILAHMGLVDFTQLVTFVEAKRDPRTGYNNNVYFDLSGAAALYQDSPYADQLAWLVTRLGDRVVFGSEFPVDTSANAADAVNLIGLSEADAGGVLYSNSARLLGL
jgi:predicted TIM-barrel fold metal-dependent hydrolase